MLFCRHDRPRRKRCLRSPAYPTKGSRSVYTRLPSAPGGTKPRRASPTRILNNNHSPTRSCRPSKPCLRQRLRPAADAFYHPAAAHPLPDPYLVAASPPPPRVDYRLDPPSCRPEFAQIFAGNQPAAGSEPPGRGVFRHQFGMWAGQAGRRRAPTCWAGRRRRQRLGETQGRRPDAYSRFRRRPRGAALVDPRVPVLRGDGCAGIPPPAPCAWWINEPVRRRDHRDRRVVTASRRASSASAPEHWAARKRADAIASWPTT